MKSKERIAEQTPSPESRAAAAGPAERHESAITPLLPPAPSPVGALALHEAASIEPEPPHLPAVPGDFLSVASLADQLEEWAQKRAVIARFLKHQLTLDTDYGPIHIGKNCEEYKQKKTCKNAYHWSKNNLFKPGSEKVAGLLQLRPTFQRDDETWEMLGKPAGVLCYRCLLLTPSGEIAGEGRGVRDVQKNDYGDMNKAVKMCEKVAQVDAILRTVALSDVFTQDLDTEEERGSKAEEKAGTTQTGTGGDGSQPREAERQALIREIYTGYKTAIIPMDHAGMYKAIFYHCFQLEKPDLIKEQPLPILEAGMDLYRRVTEPGRLEQWDRERTKPDAWIREQQRLLASEGAAGTAVPESRNAETGEDHREMPVDWLTEEQQREQQERDAAALLAQTNA